MICSDDIANLKTDIGHKIGQKIIVKGTLGRNKTYEKEATIENAYPNIFFFCIYYHFIPPKTFLVIYIMKGKKKFLKSGIFIIFSL